MHCRKVVLVAWESVVRRGEINGKGTLAAAKDKEFARLCAEVKIESAELGLAQIVSYGYDDDDGADGDDDEGEEDIGHGTVHGIPFC